MTKTIITLQELEKLLAKKLSEEQGKIICHEHPIELLPSWGSYCRQNWCASGQQKIKRDAQMAYLEINDTHEIDYYIGRELIQPF